MSNQISSNLPKYYIYKLYFKSGKTYIGQHTQRKEKDSYITSSSYFKKHLNEDPLEKREIILEVGDKYTLDIMETICILEDKAENGKNNVNVNLGSWIFSYRYRYTDEEFRKLLSEKLKGRPGNMKGVVKGPEYREKISKGLKLWYENHSGARLGKKLSKKSIEKMKKTKLSKHYHPSEETIQKMKRTNEIWRKNHLEEYKNRYEKNKKYHWFNNGQIDKFLLEKPEGWFEGRLKSSKFANKKKPKARAWNNGEFETMSVNCPLEGWVEGRLQNPKNKHLRKCIICEETGKIFQDRLELFDYLNGEFELASLTPKIRKKIPVNGFTYRYLEA